MSRFARNRRVFFIEEPLFENVEPCMRSSVCSKTGVRVHTPVLPATCGHEQMVALQTQLLESLIQENGITNYIAWYYTPMALEFSSSLLPKVTVYDCMDELSAFSGAPPAMRTNEQRLFARADLVFTGGTSLFESKRKQHSSVHLFPSGVDVAHFSAARVIDREPNDQQSIPHPRIGYAGVIDERLDLALLAQAAGARPEWQFVLLGPVAKIDPATLPQANNIHWLGMKQYADLPAYFSGWDIGMLPFALNESTRFISPTKTPEYLAAGLPVISTPISDVVTPYGVLGLVQIVDGTRAFLRVAESLLASPLTSELLAKTDRFLSQSSWDKTWMEMSTLIENQLTQQELALRTSSPSSSLTDATGKGALRV